MSESKVTRTRLLKVTTELVANPCTVLETAAIAALRRAEAQVEGSMLESMSAILLATFAVEAYLNHLADQIRLRDSFARELLNAGRKPEHILRNLRQDAPELSLAMLTASLSKEPMATLWAEERKMKFLEKLRVLTGWLDLPWDAKGDPTVQRLIQMSRMRSGLVHGKTQRATSTRRKVVAHDDSRTALGHADGSLEPVWMRLSTPRVARMSVDAAKTIRSRLSVAAGYGRHQLGLGYLGTVNVEPGD